MRRLRLNASRHTAAQTNARLCHDDLRAGLSKARSHRKVKRRGEKRHIATHHESPCRSGGVILDMWPAR